MIINLPATQDASGMPESSFLGTKSHQYLKALENYLWRLGGGMIEEKLDNGVTLLFRTFPVVTGNSLTSSEITLTRVERYHQRIKQVQTSGFLRNKELRSMFVIRALQDTLLEDEFQHLHSKLRIYKVLTPSEDGMQMLTHALDLGDNYLFMFSFAKSVLK